MTNITQNTFATFSQKFDSLYTSLTKSTSKSTISIQCKSLNQLLLNSLKCKKPQFSQEELSSLSNSIHKLEALSSSDTKIQALVKNIQKLQQKFISQSSNPAVETLPLPSSIDALNHPNSSAEKILESEVDAIKQIATNPKVKGIKNRCGNDCFLAALCQFLQTPMLQNHLVDRLPKELWESLSDEEINTTALRTALINYTNFKHNAGGNALYGQHDVSETLMSLLDRIDAPDYSYNKIGAPIRNLATENSPPTFLQPLEDYLQGAHNIFLKSLVFFIYLPLKFYHYLYEKLFSSNTLEPITEPTYTPNILKERPQRNATIPNPLTLKMTTTGTFDVSNIPEELKNHEHFGGESHKMTPRETILDHIPLPLEKSADGKSYEFQTVLKSFFTNPENNPCGQYVDKETKIIHTAPTTQENLITSVPKGLLLSFKRFICENNECKKISNPIEGITSTFTFPQELLDPSIPTTTPIDFALKTFIVHLGDSLNGGHYVSYRKEEEHWYYFNDSHCKQITEEAALNAAKNAYLTFYEAL